MRMKVLYVFGVVVVIFLFNYYMHDFGFESGPESDTDSVHLSSAINTLTTEDVNLLKDIGYEEDEYFSNVYIKNDYYFDIKSNDINLSKTYDDGEYKILIDYSTNLKKQEFDIEISKNNDFIGLIKFNDLDEFYELTEDSYIYEYPKSKIENHLNEYGEEIELLKATLQGKYTFSKDLPTRYIPVKEVTEWTSKNRNNLKGYSLFIKEDKFEDRYKKDDLYYYKMDDSENGVVKLEDNQYYEYTQNRVKEDENNYSIADNKFYIKKEGNVYQTYSYDNFQELNSQAEEKLNVEFSSLKEACTTFAKDMHNELTI